jgi:3-hydroxymyristoyl/3-hydroxydecanoyl-(acyl carrier protein) dehydratase
MPGALIVESLAQLGGVLLEAAQRQNGQHNLHALLVGIDRAKFRAMVRPGDRIDLLVESLHLSSDGGRVRGVARVDGSEQRCAEAELTFAFARVENPTLLRRRREYLNLWLTGEAEPRTSPAETDPLPAQHRDEL